MRLTKFTTPDREAQPIEIHTPGCPSGTTIKVGGHDIPNVRSVTFDCAIGKVPTVTLELVALEGVTINGHAVVIETTSLKSNMRDYKVKP